MSDDLKPCPFCGQPPHARHTRANPWAGCKTEGCWGAKLPIVSLDSPKDVEAWNTRAADAHLAAAEVPMPDADMFDQQAHIFAHSTDQLRTYGDAREAAGYAAGVTSGAKQMFDALQFAAANTTDTEWDERLCEYSESALESVSPEAHAEWKTIQRVAKESHQQGSAAGGADAERYRWLRANSDRAIGTYGDALDALIDAALRGEVK